MIEYLAGLERCLMELDRLATFFFRDDDAGWSDPELLRLMALFERFDVSLDIAVIPAAMTAAFAGELVERSRSMRLRAHQHGFAHVNHEPEGRACEFGASRAADLQRRDLEEGRRRLHDLFAGEVASIFTPPWNRCTTATAACLRELDYRVLSRDRSAGRLAIDGLCELPITMAWPPKATPTHSVARMVSDIQAAVADGQPVGVMLHHGAIRDDQWSDVAALLRIVRGSECVRCVSMESAAGATNWRSDRLWRTSITKDTKTTK